MTAPLSFQKKAALWRAYREKPTAHHVAITCHISRHTAEKYIKELNFALRLRNLQAKASQIVTDAEAKAHAENLSRLTRASRVALDDFIESIQSKTSAANSQDIDRLMRLDSFLRGGPESRTKHEVHFFWTDDHPPEKESRAGPTPAKEDEQK